MKRVKILSLFLILFLILSTVGCDEVTFVNNNLTVHFIDVGQGDSILLIFPQGKTMLIDAGTKKEGINVIKYLNKLKVSEIDYLIATHPHEDHIGGLTDIVKNFEIGSIYMPKVSHNTNTYLSLLKEIKNKNLKINTAKSGVEILNDFASIKFLAPIFDNYEDINNYSAVITVKYKNTSFLFTGDIEELSENQILSYHSDIKADLLKVAHHGSSTSTSKNFLKAVNPNFAVISVGENNQYKHPSLKVLDSLSEIKLYRTDIHGTIIAISDGEKITIRTQKEDLK